MIVNIKDDVTAQAEIKRLGAALLPPLKSFKRSRDLVTDTETLSQLKTALVNPLGSVLVRIAGNAYVSGCLDVGVPPDGFARIQIEKTARARAVWVADAVAKASLSAFKVENHYTASINAAIAKSRVASVERTDLISEYEGARLFYFGKAKGWSINKAKQKAWLIMGINPCMTCIDNELQGKISVQFPFFSTDFAPPAHIGCECFLELI